MTATNATTFAAPLAMSQVSSGRHGSWEPLLYIFTRGHLFIEALHRTGFQIFDNSLLRNVFSENYKKIARVGVLLNLQFWLGFLLLCGALHYPEEEFYICLAAR